MTAPLDSVAFFNDAGIVERYRQVRARSRSPHRTIEQPIVLEYLGDVTGKTMLDVGCGDAWIGRYALDRGLARYVGVDSSRMLIAEAQRELLGRNAELVIDDLESWDGIGTVQFDVVVSRLTLHWVRRLTPVLQVIRRHLRPGGLLVFSIEHPVMTASVERHVEDDVVTAVRLDRYFHEGTRTDDWLGATVHKQHRTLEQYFTALLAGGFRITAFSEGRPPSQRTDQRELRMHVPLCAIFQCLRES